MLKTTSSEFQSIELWFNDQNKRPLEIEDTVNITLIIGVNFVKMRYSTEPKYRKYVKEYGFVIC